MNNYFYVNEKALYEAERKRAFFKTQNRAAFLMFLLLFLELTVSVIGQLCGRYEEGFNAYLGAFFDAFAYTSYMLTPSLVYFAVRDRGAPRPVKKPSVSFSCGAALFFFGMGILYVGQLASLLMNYLFGGIGIDLNIAASDTVSSDPWYFALQIFTVAVLPAVFEELLLRRVILFELLPYGRGCAVVFSALLFSLMHMNPIQMPFTFIAGMAMAYAALYTGSLLIPMLLHFTNNALSVILMFLPEFAGEEAAYFADIAISLIIFFAGSVAAVWLITRRGERREEPEGELHPQSVREALSPAMILYIIAALVMTLLTFVSIIMASVGK